MYTFDRILNLLSIKINFLTDKSNWMQTVRPKWPDLHFKSFLKTFQVTFLLFLLILLNGFTDRVYSQVITRTFSAGANAGNPITKRAPITEIIDFKNYDDALASSIGGQSFEVLLLSGHTLKFKIKKTGNIFEPNIIPTYPNASMGAVPTYNPPAPALAALYSVSGPTDATFILEDIGVYKPDGSKATSWNIVIIDAESTNDNPESISTKTDGEAWFAWDLITNTNNNPQQTGTGTQTVRWDGTTSGVTGSYAAASIKPNKITAQMLGAKQGIALAIQSYIADKTTAVCSGFPFNTTPTEIKPATEISYTWSEPVIMGSNGFASISGASAQILNASSVSQTLTNLTNSAATATYTITPHHNSGTDLVPFNLTVTVNPKPVVIAPVDAIAVCSGALVNIDISGANASGTTYSWTAFAHANISGATNGSGNIITQTLINSGISAQMVTYAVTPTSSAGCVGETIIIKVIVDPCPPIAKDDPFTGTEDLPVTGTVGGNDSDPEGDPLKFTKVTNPENGTLIFNPDGTFIFTPNPGWSGTTKFDYQVCDSAGLCTTATVTITVDPVNDPPVAKNDIFVIPAGKPFNSIVAPNDSDPDNDPLKFEVVLEPGKGTLIFKDDGTFTYIPNTGFFGTDEFTYIACDSSGVCTEAKVVLTIQPRAIVNLTPTFSRIAEGSKVIITAILSEPLQEDVEITLGFSGDAQNAKDYLLFGNFVTIKIPAGQISTTENFVVGSLIDDVNEKEEHVLVAITGVNSVNVMIGAGADVTILDIYPPFKEVQDQEPTPINLVIKPDPLLSPNSDGYNDFFRIDNILGYPTNEVLIFNRWGNEVYRVKGYDNDAVTFRGIANTGLLTNSNKNLAEGVYFYIIYTADSGNLKHLNKGYLILKR